MTEGRNHFMKFLAVSNNTGDPTPYFASEEARTAELVAAGLFTQVLLKADWSGAVIMVEADDPTAARAAVDSLPLVASGITSFEPTPVIDLPPM
jgi:hypothetical protein